MNFFFSSRRRHTRFDCDWSSDVCSSDLAQAVTVVVRGAVRERTDGESVLVYIFGVSQQSLDEVTTADVMREVAEKGAAVWVVAHILNDGAAIGVGLCPAQILLGGLREFLQQQRPDVRLPSRIDDGLMGEDCVCVNGGRQRQQNDDQANEGRMNATKEARHHSNGPRKTSFRLQVLE